MSVQSRSLLPYQKHLINKALKFSVAFLQGCKLLVKIGRSLIGNKMFGYGVRGATYAAGDKSEWSFTLMYFRKTIKRRGC